MLKAVRTMLIILLNIIFYGLVVFGGVQLCHVSYSFAYDVLGDTSAALPPGQDKIFLIEQSESAFSVAERLEEQSLVKNRFSFYLRMQLQESDEKKVKPGSYTLNTCMSYEEILNVIVS